MEGHKEGNDFHWPPSTLVDNGVITLLGRARSVLSRFTYVQREGGSGRAPHGCRVLVHPNRLLSRGPISVPGSEGQHQGVMLVVHGLEYPEDRCP